MSKYPINKDQFNMRLARVCEHIKTESPMVRIPSIVAMEMKMVVSAYYGSQSKAAFAMLRESFFLWRHGAWTGFLLWITDTVGWTKVWHIKETNKWREHHRRHGFKCKCIAKEFPEPDGDCGMTCIDESIPKWFRKLTRWDSV